MPVRLTHGAPDAVQAAVTGVTLARESLVGGGSGAWEPVPLGSVASPPGTAWHALHYGTAAVASAGTFADTLRAAAVHGAGPTIVAGALFGATHGVQALPEGWVGRLEVGWVADRLARDAYTEITQNPNAGRWP